MKLSESRPNELVRFDLEFFKPFKATNVAEFTFKPQGDQTVVTWSMSGKNNFMFKAVSLFMNSDKMVGGMFEEGLANLKSIVEAEDKRLTESHRLPWLPWTWARPKAASRMPGTRASQTGS